MDPAVSAGRVSRSANASGSEGSRARFGSAPIPRTVQDSLDGR